MAMARRGTLARGLIHGWLFRRGIGSRSSRSSSSYRDSRQPAWTPFRLGRYEGGDPVATLSSRFFRIGKV
ncbi:MAG TPA: hypothetical protein VLH39_00740 [Magnetospirillaceae bacterium]|nr:hypothetical protein [Magnetospirillaceae bacterium]